MSFIKSIRISKHLGLCLGTALLLSACGTTHNRGTPIDDNFDHMSRLDRAFQRGNASDRNASLRALLKLEAKHLADKTDIDAALRYAQTLRDVGQLNKAKDVLRLFLKPAEGTPDVDILVEYAGLHVDMGAYEDARTYAKQAIALDETNAPAYHYLGITYDAEEEYEDAEKAFRKALEHWQGNPTPIMNTLALNLAAQEYFDESFSILERAKNISPNKIEIERNLRIVRALQQTEAGFIAKPPKLPKRKLKAKARTETEAETQTFGPPQRKPTNL